jgi:hypothetical protein
MESQIGKLIGLPESREKGLTSPVESFRARRTLAVQSRLFLENGESERRVSTELAGEGDSIAASFPRPHLLLGDARTL